MFHPDIVADYLRGRGLSPTGVVPWAAATDGSVELGDGLHVQVGTTYLAAGWFDDEDGTLHSGPVRNDPAPLPDDIAQLRLKREKVLTGRIIENAKRRAEELRQKPRDEVVKEFGSMLGVEPPAE